MELSVLKLTPRRQELLHKMGIDSVESLLKTYPFRYESFQALPYSEWQENQTVCFEGLICSPARIIRLQKKRSMTKFHVLSWNEELEITLFNRPWANQFPFGKKICIFGTYQGNNKVLASNYNFKELETQLGMRPVYRITQGMKQNEFQEIMKKALPYAKEMTSYVPERFQKKYRLQAYEQALTHIHFPNSSKELYQSIRTLKYEEFLCFQCVMQAMQQEDQSVEKEPKNFSMDKVHEWISNFDFELTEDQKSSISDVCGDMKSKKIMFRLVQGDVGCGKTIVAMSALYACLLSGYQGAFLAPTEILARQHYENMKRLNLPVSLYVSALPAKEKREVLQGMADGSISLIVGTHALFQESVSFCNLGLVVADEQQRFGVKQRRSLLEKGNKVDFLMMSATPIPRTYAHFIYGNMDISNIRTMPKGRQPVATKYIPGTTMKPVLQEILTGIEEGRQCYVVCPAIEDNDKTASRSVISIYEGMSRVLKDVHVGLLHGKMTSEEKENIMNQFSQHKIDILVSTTVIEVGIDVKNATLMVIYDAHHFGLSTLHQLRGRVARGSIQGKCFLLSGSKDPEAINRLKKLEELKDGFSISEYDLQTRGPGDILGVRQSGLPGFVFGDLQKDKAMMETCVEDAQSILKDKMDKEMLDFVKEAVEKAEYFD